MINNKQIISYVIVLAVMVVLVFVAIGKKNEEITQNPPQNIEKYDFTGWQSTTDPNSGLSFMYPADSGTQYASLRDWPPALNIYEQSYSCTTAGNIDERTGRTEEVQYNGTNYCVTLLVEGAAGSTYAQFAFAKAYGAQTLIMTFTMQFPQCLNYDEPNQSACTTEQGAVNPIAIADQIFSSIQ